MKGANGSLQLRDILKNNIRQYAMLVALITVVLFFQYSTGGILLKPLNISNLIQQNSYILIMAIGMLLCILTCGNIDLSVGSVAGFIGAVSAIMILRMGFPIGLTIGVCLFLGIAIGAWQGFWIAYRGVPAFIVTLAGMLLFRGLTMAALKGTSLAPLPPGYTFFAAGFIPDIFGGSSFNLLALFMGVALSVWILIIEIFSRRSKVSYGFPTLPLYFFIPKMMVVCGFINSITYLLSLYRGVPTVLVLLTVLTAVYTFLTTKTVAGRHIYAYGGNPKAAQLSGVKVKGVLFWVYVNMGFLAALGGIIFTGRLNSATPKAGTGFELDVIAACFVGGASTRGGVGTVIGAIIGGLLMGVLNNGMSIIGISIDWQQAIKGMVLLTAVAFDVYSKSKAK